MNHLEVIEFLSSRASLFRLSIPDILKNLDQYHKKLNQIWEISVQASKNILPSTFSESIELLSKPLPFDTLVLRYNGLRGKYNSSKQTFQVSNWRRLIKMLISGEEIKSKVLPHITSQKEMRIKKLEDLIVLLSSLKEFYEVSEEIESSLDFQIKVTDIKPTKLITKTLESIESPPELYILCHLTTQGLELTLQKSPKGTKISQRPPNDLIGYFGWFETYDASFILPFSDSQLEYIVNTITNTYNTLSEKLVNKINQSNRLIEEYSHYIFLNHL